MCIRDSTDVGGSTSHTAILARSMAIPAIVGLSNARSLIRDQELLIIDGTRGVVIVNPDRRVLEEYRLRQEQLEIDRSKLKRLKTARSETIDGIEVRLMANIELPSDVDDARGAGADGIGLFRTEFLFLGRGDMPDEDEQYEAYKKVVRGMDGRPVTMRTFDLGADKGIDTHRTKINPAPVSYTHLDVYKRQPTICASAMPMRWRWAAPWFLPPVFVTPVIWRVANN